MKIYLIANCDTCPFKNYNSYELLTVGKLYEGDLTPDMYDPQTLQPASPAYVVKCNDGKWRKVGGEYFITLEEWREQQLNKLL